MGTAIFVARISQLAEFDACYLNGNFFLIFSRFYFPFWNFRRNVSLFKCKCL